VSGGGITVSYGNQANDKILPSTIGLTPGASVNGDVIWRCADSTNPSGWSSDIGTSGVTTSLPGKYVPSSCR
jgi:hypothetical protein